MHNKIAQIYVIKSKLILFHLKLFVLCAKKFLLKLMLILMVFLCLYIYLCYVLRLPLSLTLNLSSQQSPFPHLSLTQADQAGEICQTGRRKSPIPVQHKIRKTKRAQIGRNSTRIHLEEDAPLARAGKPQDGIEL